MKKHLAVLGIALGVVACAGVASADDVVTQTVQGTASVVDSTVKGTGEVVAGTANAVYKAPGQVVDAASTPTPVGDAVYKAPGQVVDATYKAPGEVVKAGSTVVDWTTKTTTDAFSALTTNFSPKNKKK
jgi:hypothetical protein